MNWVRMLFLGDSLTTGAREPYGMSWPYYLAHAAMADQVAVLPVVEAGNHWRSAELLRAALPVMQRCEAKEAFILIGTNDAKDEGTLPSELSAANVRLLVAWCQVLEIRPYVLTVPLPAGFGSPGYTAGVVERVRAINRALRAAALPHLVECEDLRETVDGIHLGAAAAREVARRAWEAVKQVRTFA